MKEDQWLFLWKPIIAWSVLEKSTWINTESICCWLVLKAGQEGGTGTIGDISPVINVASCPDGHYIEVLLFMRFWLILEKGRCIHFQTGTYGWLAPGSPVHLGLIHWKSPHYLNTIDTKRDNGLKDDYLPKNTILMIFNQISYCCYYDF